MTDSDRAPDGHIKFVVATTGKVPLEIDEHGEFLSCGEPLAREHVVVALRSWLDEVEGEPEGEVVEKAGDFAFGVPAKPDVLRLCDDGRVLVHGYEFSEGRDVYDRLSRWVAGSKITLTDGRTGRVDMTTPMRDVDLKAHSNENFTFEPSDHKDGVRFRFTSGRGGIRPKGGNGGDVTFTAGAKRAQLIASE